MFALRCTRKLIRRMKVVPEKSPMKSTTVLGDWCANLLFTRRGQFILCVSERTLLPVLLPAADAKSLLSRLPRALGDVLATIGIPRNGIDGELQQMSASAICSATNRRVLGSMTDFAWMLDAALADGEDPLACALFLAESPCSPIGMESPDRATVAAFKAALH